MSIQSFNFIVGIGRSGTTLLMSMLNAHPQLQGTPEVNFFNFFYHSWKDKSSFTEEDRQDLNRYLNGFKNRDQSSGFTWDSAAFEKNLGDIKEPGFIKIYQAFYNSFLYNDRVKDVTHNFDKNPINTLFLEEIIKASPGSKFIYLIRDPRANYLSRKEKHKKRPANIYLDTQRWKIYNEKGWEVVRKYPEKFYILKYEDLVREPEAKLRQLGVFFGFPFDEKALAFHENVKEVSLKKIASTSDNLDPKLVSKYEKLSKPVNTNRLDVWKEKLSAKEIDICSMICGPTANHFGYDVEIKKTEVNSVAYLKGLALAKMDYYKNRLLFYTPLKLKLSRVK